MNIAISQLNYTVGDFQGNVNKILGEINAARHKRVDLIIFSELSIGGFPAFDLNQTRVYRERSQQALKSIEKACTAIACVIGGVYEEDSRLYNAAYFIANGSTQQIIKKKYLSLTDWYNESRYFHPGEGIEQISFQDKKIIVAIGEDLSELASIHKEANFVVHLNATPFSYSSLASKSTQLFAVCRKTQLPVFEVNQVGGQGDILFDGRSLVMDANGEIVDELMSFEEETKYYQVNGSIISERPFIPESHPSETALIHDALVLGVKDFFQKQGFKKAVLGLSGGLDSALVAALACEALGAENVLAVLLPSIYSTEHSLKDALDLVKNTGCTHEVIPIESAVLAFENLLAPIFKGKKADLTEENIQARARGLILMAISNKLGHVVLNTSNKSEAAVGYGTLYGDMVGSLSVLGDVYKTQAFELARYINREREIIPVHTIVKPPSAELRPDQKDSDSLPDYPILDPILFQYIDKGKSASEIIALGFEKDTVERVLKLVDNAEFKRYQAPPILRVSNKAFGRARVMPVVSRR